MDMRDWARKRNFSKMRLAGIHSSLLSMAADDTTTRTERKYLEKAAKIVRLEVLNGWKRNQGTSKKLYRERRKR